MNFSNAQENILDFIKKYISPVESTRIGETVGHKAENKKVGVGYAGDSKSKANAMAVMAGLSSAGVSVWNFGEVFETQLYFLSVFASLSSSVYVDSSLESLHILENDKMKTHFSSELVQENADDCTDLMYGKIFDMSKVIMVYCEKLIKEAQSIKGVHCTVKSENKNISLLMYDALKQDNRGELFFRINKQGTNLSVYTKETGIVPFSNLKILCEMYEIKNKRSIFIPSDSPNYLIDLALQHEGEIYDSDSFQISELWQNDALFMTLKVLSILKKENISFAQFYKDMPSIYEERKIINWRVPKDFEEKFRVEGFAVKGDNEEGFYLKNNALSAHISPMDNGKSQLYLQCDRIETAKEFYVDIEKILGSE